MPSSERDFIRSSQRNRVYYFLWIVFVIGLGLASRKFGHFLPNFIAEYSGDALWALMVYLGFGFLFPGLKIIRLAVCALVLSYGIEFSQLYHAEWIDQLRETTVGALVLGHGFLYSDLLCYLFGVLLGASIEFFVRRVKSLFDRN